MPIPTRTGYTFGGWKTSSGNVVVSTTQNTTIGNHTLSAVWTPKTYSVTYNANGGSGAGVTDTATYGTAYKTRSNTMFSRAGYSFSGWNENSSGTASDWTSWIGKDWTWTYDKNITLYAKWSVIPTTISANSTSISYTSGSSGSITVTAGGGGGLWTYSIVSSSKYASGGDMSGDGNYDHFEGNEPLKCIKISNTGQTSGGVSITCSGKYGYTIEGWSDKYDRPTGMKRYYITYQYTIRATSVYNGTYADITISFQAKY